MAVTFSGCILHGMNTSGVIDPISLFAAGEQGLWYDPSDFSTLFQDSAGTTPVTAADQYVGKILDKSGRGNHAVQTNNAKRPQLKQDANGKYYLYFNGGQYLSTPSSVDFSSYNKLSTFFAARRDTSGYLSVFGVNVPTTWIEAFYTTSGASMVWQVGGGYRECTGVTYPANYISSCQYDLSQATTAAKITPRLNGVVPTLTSAGNAAGYFGNYTNLFIGATNVTEALFKGRIYSLILRSGLTDAGTIIKVENWMTAKAGF